MTITRILCVKDDCLLPQDGWVSVTSDDLVVKLVVNLFRGGPRLDHRFGYLEGSFGNLATVPYLQKIIAIQYSSSTNLVVTFFSRIFVK